MPWVSGHYRRPRRSRAANAALGNGIIGIAIVAIVLGVIVAAVKAVLGFLATPWPWLALSAYGLFRATVRILAVNAANKVKTAILEVVAAQLDGDAHRLDMGLERLSLYADEPVAAVLLAAHHLLAARFDLASATLKALDGRDGPLLSPYPLALQLPGMTTPFLLAEANPIRDVVAFFHRHIETVRNAPTTVLVTGQNPPALETHLQSVRQREVEREREQRTRVEAERQATEDRMRQEAAAREVRERQEAKEQAERARRAAIERDARQRREAAERERTAAARSEEKILAAKTLAGRRAALRAGLDAINTPALRQHLLTVAARAEVEGVLAKAAALKTAKAKRRHLEDALAALRADDVPDDLQTTEIALLQDSLAALGA